MMDEEQDVKDQPQPQPEANDTVSAPQPQGADDTATDQRRPPRGLTLKVSAKGALSVYGLGRFPVTLYKEQWIRLLAMSDELRTFIKENEGTLKSKSAS